MTLHLRLLSLLVSAAVALSGAALAAQDRDSFYQDLLAQGIGRRASGDLKGARDRLRVACFGLLDDPPALARCLVHLSLVDADLKEDEALAQTLDRLIEVETRFGAYTAADLEPDTRQLFEALAGERVEESRLRAQPAFAPMLRERELERLRALPPDERRARLMELAAGEPAEAAWPLTLARLESDRQKPEEVVRWADDALRIDPGSSEAACLLRDAAATLDDCAAVVANTLTCTQPPASQKLPGLILECLVGREAWHEARRFLEQLPAELSRQERIRRLAGKLPPASLVSSE